MEDCRSQLRGAVALNNIGVSLVERESHHHALQSFQDAIVLLKSSLEGSATSLVTMLTMLKIETTTSSVAPSANSEDDRAQEVARMLKRASQSLSRASGRPNVGTGVRTICDTTDIREIESVLSQSPFESGDSQQAAKFLPMRIELCANESLDPMEAARVCVVVLHNFGLACLCCAKIVPASAILGRQLLLENTVKIFELCQLVLSTRSSSCTDIYQLRQMFFLGYVVVNSFVHTLIESGHPMETLEVAYSPKLQSLKAAVRELCVPGFDAKRNTATAA